MPRFLSNLLSPKPKTNNHANICSHHFWTALGNILLVTPCFSSWILMLALSHFSSGSCALSISPVRSDTSRYSIPILMRLAEWVERVQLTAEDRHTITSKSLTLRWIECDQSTPSYILECHIWCLTHDLEKGNSLLRQPHKFNQETFTVS